MESTSISDSSVVTGTLAVLSYADRCEESVLGGVEKVLRGPGSMAKGGDHTQPGA